MNISVVAFAAILIIGGIVTGVTFIIVLGVFVLIPGLLASPRKQSKIPVSKTPQSQRANAPSSYSPPPRAQPSMATQTPAKAHQQSYLPESVVPTPSMALQSAYAPPLFPTSMFPTLSLPSTYRQAGEVKEKPQPSERDELLELALLVAILKLASG